MRIYDAKGPISADTLPGQSSSNQFEDGMKNFHENSTVQRLLPAQCANDLTMSSREIAELCEKNHADVLRDIRVMLEQLEEVASKFAGYYLATNGKQNPCFDLPKDLTLTLVAGYNVKLRKRIIDRWLELEAQSSSPALPNFSDPIAAARAWADEREARLQAETKRAEIADRREATAMNTASQAVKRANRLEKALDRSKQYATLKRMSMLYHGQDFSWRELKYVSLEMGMPPIDVFDANYGTVKAYHADVWREVYALEIPQSAVTGSTGL